MTDTAIAFVHGRRVWDSRGRPTVDFEDVADEDALMRAERVRILGGWLLDHLVDRLAKALAVAGTSDQPEEIA